MEDGTGMLFFQSIKSPVHGADCLSLLTRPAENAKSASSPSSKNSLPAPCASSPVSGCSVTTAVFVFSKRVRRRFSFPIHALYADPFFSFLFHQLPKAKKSSPTPSGATKPKSSSASPPSSNTTTSTSKARPSRRPRPLG